MPQFGSSLLLFSLFIVLVLIHGGSSGVHAAPDEIYYVKTIVGKASGTSYKVNLPALEAYYGQARGVVQSKNGDLYIPAVSYHAVLKVQFDTRAGTSNVTIVAGTGRKGKGAENELATESALSYPSGISLIEDESTGEAAAMLIVDMGNHRIRQLNMTTMMIRTIAGTGDSGFSGDGGLATHATFSSPSQAYYDRATRDIFIVDSVNHRIRRMFARNGTVTTVVGGKKCSETVNNGDGGRATDACLKTPLTMCISGWFIADIENHRIRKVDPTNGIITTAVGGGDSSGDGLANSVKLNSPWSVGFTSSGELLIGEVGTLVRKMYSDGMVKVIAGGGSDESGEGILAKQASVRPTFVAQTRRGILIAEQGGRIKQLYPTCYGVAGFDSFACSGHGTCSEVDQCSCDDEWTGNDCSVTHCFDIMSNETSVCSGHGSCNAPDNCTCGGGWAGVDCSVHGCFGVMFNETSTVCSGHGSCIAPDQCECEDGWMGKDCSKPYTYCFGVMSNETSTVCYGHGTCIDEDQCQCDRGWLADDCSVTHCFGFTSNLSDRVCSGKGKCIKPNKCQCDDGFKGHKCHIKARD